MKRRAVWAVLLAAALLVLPGCQGSETVEPPEGVPPSVVVPEGMAPVDKKIVCDKSGIIEIGAGRHIILFR